MPFSFNNGQSNQGVSEVEVSSFDRKKDDGPDFVVIALFGVFIILLLVSAGMYFYMSSLEKKIEGKKSELSQYEGSLKGVPIEEIKAISTKLKVTSQLVREHPFVSTVLKIIELSIEDGITWNTFSITLSDKTNNYILNLAGISKDYSSIYRQAEVFKKEPYSKYLSKIEVSPLKLPDDKGNIKFTMSMNVSIKGILPDSVVVEESTKEEAKLETATTPSVTGGASVPPVISPTTN